jgi:branched-chain amino acid transport system ATP-binding protein
LAEGSILLLVEEVDVRYGLIQVIFGVSFEVRKAEITTIIGPNGAGKTTLLFTIAGILRNCAGKILYEQERVDTLPAWERVKKGLVLCPERRRLFPNMSVLDNLLLGAYLQKDENKVGENLERVFSLFPVLKERSKQLAGTLSGGEQQMVAIGRSLMSNPKLLMLDEPSVGLSPLVRSKIFEQIMKIRDETNTAILLVEQDAANALLIADRAYVLEDGKIVMGGTAEEVGSDKRVREVYLGL